MDRRSGATPMDFQWNNGSGPVDLSSPFSTLGRRQDSDTTRHNQQTGMKKAGSHSAFSSPSKANAPSLRPPNGQQSFLFSRNANPLDKPLPAEPYRPSFDPKFSTPRKLEVDYSSGGETPETGVDSEVNTPEYKPAKNKMSHLLSGKPSPTKDRRVSFMGRLFGSPKSSPGRGEIVKKDRKELYSKKGEDRVRRRRQKEVEKQLSRRGSRDDSDDERSTKRKDRNGPTPPMPRGSIVGTILTFVHDHPALPHVLSWYLQLLFNAFLIFLGMYIIWSFWSTIRNDVDQASQAEIAKVIAEMAICADHYRANDCETSKLPALRQLCENWKTCMNQDEKAIGRARVSAHTFARIFNSFVEPISYKAMIFSVVIVAAIFISSNMAFNVIRHKAENLSQQYAPQYGYGPPPATPQRFPSGGQQFYTPYTHGVGYGTEPRPSQQVEAGAGDTKRLEW